eukprot:TRINITY_DN2497_c0_g1_i1.p1 TRINITY_DN2497_c0_g1~~TRINITY_DN2497_c0_g1_i1.p1  ORF type:complete len:174 (+),score=20.73 TRINITY_DN2497_c0_g1_i1:451-972(+)
MPVPPKPITDEDKHGNKERSEASSSSLQTDPPPCLLPVTVGSCHAPQRKTTYPDLVSSPEAEIHLSVDIPSELLVENRSEPQSKSNIGKKNIAVPNRGMSQVEESHDMVSGLSLLGKGPSASPRSSPSTLPKRHAKGKQLQVQTSKEPMQEIKVDITRNRVTTSRSVSAYFRL